MIDRGTRQRERKRESENANELSSVQHLVIRQLSPASARFAPGIAYTHFTSFFAEPSERYKPNFAQGLGGLSVAQRRSEKQARGGGTSGNFFPARMNGVDKNSGR